MLLMIFSLLIIYALIAGSLLTLVAWLCCKRVHGLRIILLIWFGCVCVVFVAFYALQFTEFGLIR
ncbi:Uncharacterised protein [Klebsiella oxytoca]|nr:hypothetical protein HMPREF9687_01821 [Klebsiella oxytoca 10-5243]EYT07929.1 hypothetical protein T655_01840 [Klebsiella oxytoca G54]KLY11845.1 hypothetical protein SK88_03387 [Klebsiella oxytoca]KLY27159.1 hypothetical protein SK92_04677 [Klebsiella oxytoca]CAA0286674.1 Uncharacterised protein [Klebsiella oxytoca]